MRIAVGGFQHETNSFAAVPADFAQFEAADGWPGLSRGAALEPALAGINLPAAGFIDRARAAGHAIVPLCWANAAPSGPVTDQAFEAVARMLVEDLRAALPVDAVYLDLHGAMVTASLEDGEGEILARIRDVVGPAVPIVASLDLHANITRRMVEMADRLVPYRTYPHVDMAATGARAFDGLAGLSGGGAAGKAFRQVDFLIPLVAQSTLEPPGATLYARLETLEARHGVSLGLAMGFPAADIADCGPSIVGYGPAAAAATAVATLAAAVAAEEPHFRAELLSPDAAVAAAMAAAPAGGPVILADTQDNPGGGAESDGVDLLAALIAARAEGAVLGVLADGATAAAAHGAGIGAVLDRAIGAGSRYGGAVPLPGRWTVEVLGDGRFTGTGPFYGGNHMQLGPMTLLRAEAAPGVRVVVSTRKQQAADQAMFRHLGVEPAAQRILALKSSVHFRADFGPLAARILLVEARGPNLADPAAQPFTRLRPGVRLRPMGPTFDGPRAS